jgi:hypothetical protein
MTVEDILVVVTTSKSASSGMERKITFAPNAFILSVFRSSATRAGPEPTIVEIQ